MKTTNSKLSIILAIVALICFGGAGFLFVQGFLDDQRSQDTMEALRPSQETVRSTASYEPVAPESVAVQKPDTTSQSAASGPTAAQEPDTVPQSATPDSTATAKPDAAQGLTPDPKVANPYAESFLANEDMAAWLQIPDTVIDYPVMWTPRDENYYLYRDFDGSDNKNGSLILDTDSSLNPLTTNLIIHGHNMRSGAMFGNLTDYEDEDYYQEHKQITLYTEECQRNYEVIAAFRSQVYRKSDQVFKFYKFFQADTQEEFDDFYKNIKQLSLYDTGVTAKFGDHFLTLSPCVYHVENGRFVVVAKEVENGDSYLPLQAEGNTTN